MYSGGGLSVYSGGGLSVYSGGGLSTYSGGGLSTSPGGGLYNGPGGGLWDGPCSEPYRSNIPPIHVFIPKLREHGFAWAADILAEAHGLNL
ncbi:hypothetical protein [Nocardioides malaquae]|uniref:hypothetical protein n=1 Tax=Nocardioides malaquae TaxID=2773426 RepID=UPI001D0D194F|nr:hypothetical protein [Nocardioides malaquae]